MNGVPIDPLSTARWNECQRLRGENADLRREISNLRIQQEVDMNETRKALTTPKEISPVELDGSFNYGVETAACRLESMGFHSATPNAIRKLKRST